MASAPTGGRATGRAGKTQAFADIAHQQTESHVPTGVGYWDRLLSGGLVAGSVTLLGGEPGIGKSTVLAQLGLALSANGKQVLYVTGEESPSQVALRLKRLATTVPPSFSFLDLTDAPTIAATIQQQKPALTIIDSVQTLRMPDVPGEAGNPTQIKASSALISEAAKKSHASVILVGQVTKDGDLAGPRLLEHLVDTVIMMEGDRSQLLRIMRVLKHRFGSTEESAILAMHERGLEEVLDPSSLLLADRPARTSGSVVTCLVDGSRSLLVEIQALVTPAGYGTPSRRATGIDANRLSLLLAVLSRRVNMSFADQDVFVNAVGGIDAKDPSIDLALALALISAKRNTPLPPDLLAFGEIGLAGEIRPVPRANARIKEGSRLGLKTVCLPKDKSVTPVEGVRLMACGNLGETLNHTHLT